MTSIFASAVNDGTYRLIESNRPLFVSVRNKQVNRFPDLEVFKRIAYVINVWLTEFQISIMSRIG